MGALGVPVAVNFRSASAEADTVVRQIESLGGKAVALQADVSNIDEVVQLARHAEAALGPLSIVVNNAGITRDRLVLQMSEEDWAATWMTDLAGPAALSRTAASGMAGRGYGRIVNVSSVVGSAGNAGQANYAAAKSALLGLTREMAVEYAHRGVTVNCVIPGLIRTDAVSHLSESQKRWWMQRIPADREAEAYEVAELVVFLASPRAGYITGQCIAIDGGYLAAMGRGWES